MIFCSKLLNITLRSQRIHYQMSFFLGLATALWILSCEFSEGCWEGDYSV